MTDGRPAYDLAGLLALYRQEQGPGRAAAGKQILAFVGYTSREKIVETLMGQGVDRGDAETIYDGQVAPQQLVEQARDQGRDIGIALVNTDPAKTEGYLVTCVSCKREARLPFQPTPGKVLMCPACQRLNVAPTLNRAARRDRRRRGH